jgi:hypothetical protein
MKSSCLAYNYQESKEFISNAIEALASSSSRWAEIRFSVKLVLGRNPKGLDNPYSGIERVGDTSIYSRGLNTIPPVVIVYEVDEVECEVHPLAVHRVLQD